ncbi:MAG: SPOR domain-containing protein, partial [Aristaeellaceae bacterium]
RLLLFLTAMVVLAGVASHFTGRASITATPLPEPTATPVTAAFDETVTTREVALPQSMWYAIQTGVYSTREVAEGRVDAYADRGAPGYVAEDEGKWRVFIACYGSREDAAAVRERLNTMQQVDTYLHEWACPALTLRLSGMAGQLDVAEAGLVLPEQTARLMRDTAIALDAGEVMPDAARATIASLGESMALWAQTARERFAQPYPPLVEAILTIAQDWPARQSAMEQAKDATALSAAMKQQAMALYDQAGDLRRQLMQ